MAPPRTRFAATGGSTAEGSPRSGRREEFPDEARVHFTDPKAARAALQAVSRVLKGWQEDAEMGGDRRSWRWLLEGDTNADGYDATGEPFSAWGFLRVALDHGGLG